MLELYIYNKQEKGGGHPLCSFVILIILPSVWQSCRSRRRRRHHRPVRPETSHNDNGGFMTSICLCALSL